MSAAKNVLCRWICKYCGNYLNLLQFTNSKKNSFRRNYMRKFLITADNESMLCRRAFGNEEMVTSSHQVLAATLTLLQPVGDRLCPSNTDFESHRHACIPHREQVAAEFFRTNITTRIPLRKAVGFAYYHSETGKNIRQNDLCICSTQVQCGPSMTSWSIHPLAVSICAWFLKCQFGSLHTVSDYKKRWSEMSAGVS